MHDPMVVAFEIRRPWPRRWTLTTDQRWWWPPMLTVWHVEPGGRNAGAVCPRRARWRHPHHWHLQAHPLQQLRRWLLTRCAGCGGRSTKAQPVDTSANWRDDNGRWWRGEPDLYHAGCNRSPLAVEVDRLLADLGMSDPDR